jgi:hypothetical protein
MTAIPARARSHSCPTGSNPAHPNCPAVPAAQPAPLRFREEVTGPANCQVVQEAAKELALVVRPQVEATAPAHSLDVRVKAIDQEYVHLEAVKVIAPEFVPLEAVKETDRECDLPAVVKAIDQEHVPLEAAKVIGQDDRQVEVTVRSNCPSAPAKVTDQDVRQESAIRIDHPSQDLRLPVDHRERVLQGSDRQAGAPQAIVPLDGGHQCIGRPLPVHLFGTRGTDPAIARQATGGVQ